jgi:hypothetical protein
MRSDGRRIKDHRFTSDDKLFFDANIWIFIFGPNAEPDNNSVKTYSNALNRARKAGSRIEIDLVVLSEFVNRCLRLDYNQLRDYKIIRDDFKTYRKTPEYAASVAVVANNARKILSLCQLIESDFTHCDHNAILTRLGAAQSDLNDEFIVSLCQRRGLMLVTDDGDYLDSELTILTRNSVYFQPADAESNETEKA